MTSGATARPNRPDFAHQPPSTLPRAAGVRFDEDAHPGLVVRSARAPRARRRRRVRRARHLRLRDRDRAPPFPPRSLDEVRGIVERSIASARVVPREEYALAVVEQATGVLVGFGRLAGDPHQQRAATMGFALRPASWGVGYGRETVGLLLALAFGELDLHRVWAARAPLNTASARTLLAAGFVEEGLIRGHVHVRGARRDSVTYGILREEWAALSPRPRPR
ncbi:GNAT family N-acetyltransferase [Streptomyces sp. NPDC093795]|uniref:GNAT family N-acetyltransferase n=1 Tax=Streptomyces sp. NPDC093795 TaxID=3366051 RepID=UPI00382675FD